LNVTPTPIMSFFIEIGFSSASPLMLIVEYGTGTLCHWLR
jgi:hypothetical protein